MENFEPSTSLPRWQRLLYILAPLLVLLSCLTLINLTPPLFPVAAATPAADDTGETAVFPSNTPRPSTLSTPIPTFTHTPPPTPTTPPTPTLPPTATLTLSAPPANATFVTEALITFVWQWSPPLGKDEQLSLYLSDGAENVRVVSLTEPNFGSNYRATLKTADFFPNATSIIWTIHLETANGTLLYRSPERLFQLMP